MAQSALAWTSSELVAGARSGRCASGAHFVGARGRSAEGAVRTGRLAGRSSRGGHGPAERDCGVPTRFSRSPGRGRAQLGARGRRDDVQGPRPATLKGRDLRRVHNAVLRSHRLPRLRWTEASRFDLSLSLMSCGYLDEGTNHHLQRAWMTGNGNQS